MQRDFHPGNVVVRDDGILLRDWSFATVPQDRMRNAWRVAKPLAAVVELMKLIELADLVGPDHDFNWLPMTYGWAFEEAECRN